MVAAKVEFWEFWLPADNLNEKLVVGDLQNLVQKFDLPGIQMPLAHLDLGQGAAGDVAAPDLQFGGQLLLCQMPGLPQKPNAASHLLVIAEIHTLFPPVSEKRRSRLVYNRLFRQFARTCAQYVLDGSKFSPEKCTQTGA